MAVLIIDSNSLTIDWNITVNNIELPVVAAHIHQGAFGTNGPVVVDFDDNLSGSGLFDTDLAAVLANPTGFYVNVHNVEFPAGAIRGQLSAAIPEPAFASMSLLGVAGLAGIRRRWCHGSKEGR